MIPQQTTYSRTFNDRVAGQPADAGQRRLTSRLNDSGGNLPAGVGLYESAEGKVNYPSSSAHKLMGLVVNDYSRDPNGLSGSASAYGTGKQVPLMEEGAMMVVVDQDVAVGDPVFVRFATSVNDATHTQKGAFRKDGDGAAEVHVVTPTAVNSTTYILRAEVLDANGVIQTFTFEYLSDGSATATEIVTGFKTVMAANAEFTALVVASGTATLVLTGQRSGEAFKVQSMGDGALADSVTTPAAPTARKVKGAYWVTGGTAAAGIAELHFDRSDEWA